MSRRLHVAGEHLDPLTDALERLINGGDLPADQAAAVTAVRDQLRHPPAPRRRQLALLRPDRGVYQTACRRYDIQQTADGGWTVTASGLITETLNGALAEHGIADVVFARQRDAVMALAAMLDVRRSQRPDHPRPPALTADPCGTRLRLTSDPRFLVIRDQYGWRASAEPTYVAGDRLLVAHGLTRARFANRGEAAVELDVALHLDAQRDRPILNVRW